MARSASPPTGPCATASPAVDARESASGVAPLVRVGVAAALAWALSTGSTARAAGEPVATVVGASGESVVIRPAMAPERLRAGMTLSGGERIVTRADGRVTMRLDDGTVIALHPHTDFPIDVRRIEAEAPRGLLALMRSALRTVSEALGRRAPGETRPPQGGGTTIGRRHPAPLPAVPDQAAAQPVCAGADCGPAPVRLAAGPAGEHAPPR
jgi:hypothetical protein